jgi:hypothetical protein
MMLHEEKHTNPMGAWDQAAAASARYTRLSAASEIGAARMVLQLALLYWSAHLTGVIEVPRDALERALLQKEKKLSNLLPTKCRPKLCPSAG